MSPVFTVTVGSVDHVSLLIESQDVVSDTGRSPALHLVFVSEQLLSRRPSAVVQLSVSQNTEEGALTGVHVPHNCNPVDRERERWGGNQWTVYVSSGYGVFGMYTIGYHH